MVNVIPPRPQDQTKFPAHPFQTSKNAARVIETELSLTGSLEQSLDDENFLVISPYTDRPHLLDLRTLDTQSAFIARALTVMRSLRPDYATSVYKDTFNWSEIVDNLRQLTLAAGYTWTEQKFFIVVFRSCIPPTTDYGHLGDLDKDAHAEAMASGGFLK
jgi:hypothetical protein